MWNNSPTLTKDGNYHGMYFWRQAPNKPVSLALVDRATSFAVSIWDLGEGCYKKPESIGGQWYPVTDAIDRLDLLVDLVISMNKRISVLEKKVGQLDAEAMMHRPLGPGSFFNPMSEEEERERDAEALKQLDEVLDPPEESRGEQVARKLAESLYAFHKLETNKGWSNDRQRKPQGGDDGAKTESS